MPLATCAAPTQTARLPKHRQDAVMNGCPPLSCAIRTATASTGRPCGRGGGGGATTPASSRQRSSRGAPARLSGPGAAGSWSLAAPSRSRCAGRRRPTASRSAGGGGPQQTVPGQVAQRPHQAFGVSAGCGASLQGCGHELRVGLFENTHLFKTDGDTWRCTGWPVRQHVRAPACTRARGAAAPRPPE